MDNLLFKMSLTCTTITIDSLERGSNIFSLIIVCCILYCVIILLISGTVRSDSEDLPYPLRAEKFFGTGDKFM